jgi:hypothetical protein
MLVENTSVRISKLEFFILVLFSSYEELHRTTMWGGFSQRSRILND